MWQSRVGAPYQREVTLVYEPSRLFTVFLARKHCFNITKYSQLSHVATQ